MIFIPPFPSKTVINGQSKDLLDSTGSEGQGIDGNSLHLIMGFDMCLTNEKTGSTRLNSCLNGIYPLVIKHGK